MANRASRIEVSIPTASFDGRYYGRYPSGNAPHWAAGASSVSSAVAALTSGGGSGADWASRSAGRLQAVRFDNLSAVNTYAFNEDGNKGAGWTASHITFDTSAPVDGSPGAARINCLDADGADNGNLQFYIDPVLHTVYGTGQDFFIQWRQYMPSAYAYAAFLGSGGNNPGFGNGSKQIIVSQYESNGQGGTNVSGEIVVENTDQMCCPRMYYTDPGGSDQLIQTLYNGGNDARWQNQIVNASPADTSGTLVYPQSAQKYGPMYDMRGAGKINLGAPDPNNGGWIYLPNNWMTFEIHVRQGTVGSSNTLIEFWAAYDGEPPVLVHKMTTANPGAATAFIYSGFTLMTYCTLRTTNGGFDTYCLFQSVISDTSAIPFPGGFPITPS